MIGKLDEYLRFNETALSLRAQRQQLLASNIANADTPNYKARDIDFNSALKGALAQQNSPTATAQAPALAKTATTHLNSKSADSLDGMPLLYRNASQGNIDGNTVDIDAERNQFTDNSIRYEAGLTLISAQIKYMLAAIQG
jgi:flagellar basal-body rod protein FlgB